MDFAVLCQLVSGSEAVLNDHERQLIAVPNLIERIAQAFGIDLPSPIARLEIRVGHSSHKVTTGLGGHLRICFWHSSTSAGLQV